MAAGATYTTIAATTLTSNQTSVEFTSIPQTYTDLVIVFCGKAVSTGGDVRCRLGNGSFDTGNNYSYTVLHGNGTTAGSARESSQPYCWLDYWGSVTSDDTHLGIYQFMNYSNTTTYKTFLSRSNRAASGVDALVGLWRSTSAINQIQLALGSAGTREYASGTTATLYGIAAA
jgi:hypothetical protein